MERKKRHTLLHWLLDYGEMLLGTGAEIYRVEDTLTRIGQAYGAAKVSIFVITSNIMLTLNFPDGIELTQTRRITASGPTDFIKMERLNALSRRCCREQLSLEELRQELNQLDQPIPASWLYTGRILGAGCFAVFFGGNFLDGLVAAFFGWLICFLQRKMGDFCPNTVVFNLLCSFFVSLGLGLLGSVVPALHTDMIMIGDIMLLIPGLGFTNALRDMLVGDTISGVTRMIESLLGAAGLAGGVMSAMWLIGG
ncbi:MAG: threonine/serine exporter family protein [Firmicutes bacterium]|nr:threonine/serine exporter family protein [Bacillota bacterium]